MLEQLKLFDIIINYISETENRERELKLCDRAGNSRCIHTGLNALCAMIQFVHGGSTILGWVVPGISCGSTCRQNYDNKRKRNSYNNKRNKKTNIHKFLPNTVTKIHWLVSSDGYAGIWWSLTVSIVGWQECEWALLTNLPFHYFSAYNESLKQNVHISN